ncbi:MAG: metallophosphoesterase [Clostridia bacterium]|nr:metallophosphoesterase [Clostridia bacterium]
MKRIFSLILFLCLFAMLLLPTLASSEAEGLYFDSYKQGKTYSMDTYQSAKNLQEVPHTFEAMLYAERSGWQGGTILGNDNAKSGGRFTFTLNKNFYPQLTFKDKNGATHSAVFKNASFPSAAWTHLAIAFDEEKKEFRCYVNGVLQESIAFSDTCPEKCKDGCLGIFSLASASQYPFLLGGDLHYLNPNFFRGGIRDVALYSSVLSGSEIFDSFQNGVDASNEHLILYYDIDSSDKGKDIKDQSGGYDLIYSRSWLTEEEMNAEREKKGFSGKYEYSIAVIGDPQYATHSYPEAIRAAYTWLAENKDEKNIQYVIGLGDLTDQCQRDEWIEAASALQILQDAGLYYSVVRGNHDTALSGIEDYSQATARPELFDKLFAEEITFYYDQFLTNGGLYEEGSVKNTYRTLDCEGDEWLILNLDWRVEDAVLDWAKGVIEAHPEHRVIIVTHDYLSASGVQSANGKRIWDTLAGQYENVVMALGGHYSWDNILVNQAEGIHGNTVTQMLIDPQRADDLLEGVGLVTMFYFSEDGSVVDVEYYSPEWDRYYKNANQMRINLKTERFESHFAPILWVSIGVGACGGAVGVFFLLKARRKRAAKKEQE